MIITKTYDEIMKPLTAEQLAELDALADPGFVDEPDEDCPEYTAEELKKMREAAVKKLAEREKSSITLNISRFAIENAKRLGAGDPVSLEKILENALKDDDFVLNSLRSVG